MKKHFWNIEPDDPLYPRYRWKNYDWLTDEERAAPDPVLAYKWIPVAMLVISLAFAAMTIGFINSPPKDDSTRTQFRH